MTLKAVDLRSPADGKSGNWWAVRCPGCHKWLTKFDESAEQALQLARGALRKDHRCGYSEPSALF